MTHPTRISTVPVEDDRVGLSPATLQRAFTNHVQCTRGHRLPESTEFDRYVALALAVRDRLMQRMADTERSYRERDAKRVFYLSAEFLLGRMLVSNLQALGIDQIYREVLGGLGLDLDALVEQEPEPGLGNGGLGRLAACFLESMATLGLPSRGHGIRYEFGIFEQVIRHGQQVERADEWLRFGNPWEVARPENAVEVRFGGTTHVVPTGDGGFRVVWTAKDTVLGVPHDIPVAGYGNHTVHALRLWAARSSREFDLHLFNAGDYVNAVEQKNASEVISKVLYPNDNFQKGRELRLRQEYFFVSCAIADIVGGYVAAHGNLDGFSDKTAIQLNDTHPAVAVAELMRIFVDDHRMPWEQAWDQSVATFGFTNHTLMPEALERWPVSLFARLLPRHLEIIQEIDRRFCREVRTLNLDDPGLAERMAIVDRTDRPQIHMARLAVVGSHAVNGVAALHTDLLKRKVMGDFYRMYPERFSNKTNGVTPRRWLLACNPALAGLITERIGKGWVTQLELLERLEPAAADPAFLEVLHAIKRQHKETMAAIVYARLGVRVDPDAIFDVHIKRLHEYKRQLLNVLHIAALYLRAKRGGTVVPRLFLFGAKAAPGYQRAKLIIRLIHAVAELVNTDRRTTAVRVAFLPNYGVSLAERLIPAADVSEQISTAGKEASGTGNMKLAMNGALTVGTLDGANIEIRQAVGDDNFFHFGMTVQEVAARWREQPGGRDVYERCEALREVVDLIRDGFFLPEEPDLFRPLMDELLERDAYMVLGDFEAYAGCQARVADAYLDQARWRRMAALNIARIGRFSSDRTIREYARDIWHVEPVEVPAQPA